MLWKALQWGALGSSALSPVVAAFLFTPSGGVVWTQLVATVALSLCAFGLAVGLIPV